MKLDREDMFYGKSEIEHGFETAFNKALQKIIDLIQEED